MDDELKVLLLKQVESKVAQFQYWEQIRWEGGRLWYETTKLANELADYDTETQIAFLELLSEQKFRIYDNHPSSAPEITSKLYAWLEDKIVKLKIFSLQQRRKLSESHKNEGISKALTSANHIPSPLQPVNEDDVFISYSWDSDEHQREIYELVNELRRQGFTANMDLLLSQEETSINFLTMMHKAMLRHKKIIVVLSTGYKFKAEAFTGGVGEEYQILINDIKSNPQKYILVSLNGYSDEVIPLGLKGRHIVDLKAPSGKEELHAKLLDHRLYEFDAVGPEKPKLTVIKPNVSDRSAHNKPIEIEPPLISQTGNFELSAQLYTEAEFKMSVGFKNILTQKIDGLGYEIKFSKWLMEERIHQIVDDDIVVVGNIEKIYAGQLIHSPEIKITITSGNISRVFNTNLSFTVYTEFGTTEATFALSDVIKIFPKGAHYQTPVLLEREMFH